MLPQRINHDRWTSSLWWWVYEYAGVSQSGPPFGADNPQSSLVLLQVHPAKRFSLGLPSYETDAYPVALMGRDPGPRDSDFLITRRAGLRYGVWGGRRRRSSRIRTKSALNHTSNSSHSRCCCASSSSGVGSGSCLSVGNTEISRSRWRKGL